MTAELFSVALGVESPWSVTKVDFDQARKRLTILIDFKKGTRFAVAGAEGAHPVHDTTAKSYRHLNFFQHECHLDVRVPRVKLPDGSVRLVEPPFAGKLKGFTLLFEALVLVQTKKTRPMPIILMHSPFWAGLVEWLRGRLVEEKMIDPADVDLIQVIDDPKAVAEAIFAHYEKRGFQLLPSEREVMLNL